MSKKIIGSTVGTPLSLRKIADSLGGSNIGGGSRTYVFDTFIEFADNIAIGDMVTEVMNVHELQTGDQVIIKAGDTPPFWFEKKTTVADNEKWYTYNGVGHSLIVYECMGQDILGVFHPVESVGGGGDIPASNYYTKGEIDEQLGDVEAALDHIIAIQEILIGGAG